MASVPRRGCPSRRAFGGRRRFGTQHSNISTMDLCSSKGILLCVSAALLTVGCAEAQRYRYRNVSDSARRLSSKLFNSTLYEAKVRPMKDDTKWMYISTSLYVIGLRYVDATANKFSLIMLICLSWNDPRIRWSPRAYSNIESVRVSSYQIWTPQVAQTISVGSMSQGREAPLIVSYKGNVTDCVTKEVISTCYMDFYNFPYDTHDCIMGIDMTGMRIEMLAFALDPISAAVVKNGEWQLSFKHIDQDPKGPVILHFTIRRVSSHYTATVYMPTLAILLAAVGASWIPSALSRARSSLLAGLLLVNILLSRHTCRLVEGTQTLPRIVLLQNGCLGFLTLGIISSCVAEFVHKTQSPWIAPVKQMQGVVDTYLLPAAGVLLVFINQMVS